MTRLSLSREEAHLALEAMKRAQRAWKDAAEKAATDTKLSPEGRRGLEIQLRKQAGIAAVIASKLNAELFGDIIG